MHGQRRLSGTVAALVGSATVGRVASISSEQLSGPLFGLRGTLRFWRVELIGQYAQGNLGAEGGSVSEDLVEGGLTLAVRPVPQLSLGIGPHARSYVTDVSTERWTFWEARARLETDLVGTSVRSSLEGWFALSGGVSTALPFGNGRGIEGGVRVRVASTPAWVRLAYRVDRGTLSNDLRVDTVEQLFIQVGIGR
jgi:hypothetical protein